MAKPLTIAWASLNVSEFIVERSHANVENAAKPVFSIYILIITGEFIILIMELEILKL